MDIFAHALWTGAASKTINRKLEKGDKQKLHTWEAVFWGVFPDLFAFAVPFIAVIIGLLTHNINLSDLPSSPSHGEPPPTNHFWALNLASVLYSVSHSAIVFLAVFAVFWLVLKRPYWELGGWLFHLLIDIPTHSYNFYPTPIFWPLSGAKFGGISWATPWFMILNYSALILVYLFLRKRRPRSNQSGVV